MDEQIKIQWIDDLLSGKYVQEQHVLRSGVHRFCVLGVLADQAVRKGMGSWCSAGGYYAFCDENENLFNTNLPVAIQKWADLPGHCVNRLMAENDTGVGFEVLADYIKDKL